MKIYSITYFTPNGFDAPKFFQDAADAVNEALMLFTHEQPKENARLYNRDKKPIEHERAVADLVIAELVFVSDASHFSRWSGYMLQQVDVR